MIKRFEHLGSIDIRLSPQSTDPLIDEHYEAIEKVLRRGTLEEWEVLGEMINERMENFPKLEEVKTFYDSFDSGKDKYFPQ